MTTRGVVPAVDNSDWLKTFAIILVVVGHTGYFFIEDAAWWSVFGRMAAPVFFFLMGYAHSRTIPLLCIWLGIILTLLDSWNTNWEWVAANILLGMAFIRLSRPSVLHLLQRYGWLALVIFILCFLVVLPFAGEVVDYGAEGLLWALFGLCQRMYVDGRSTTSLAGTAREPGLAGQEVQQNWAMMRLPACLVTAVVYIWQEQIEYSFSEVQLAVVAAGVGWCFLFENRMSNNGSSRISHIMNSPKFCSD